MTYRVIEQYDSRMPSSAGNGTKLGCLFGHDTEGGTGLAGAQGTITFLINSAERRNASYHEVWAFDEAPGDFTAIRIVRPNRAAHSCNPHPPNYEPTEAAKAALGVNATNPNQGGYAVSIAGRIADVNRYSADARFLTAARRRLAEIKAEVGVETIIEHFQLNPSTRTDWGRLMTPALTGATLPDTSTEDPMPTLTTRLTGVAVRVPAGTDFRKAPSFGTAPYYRSPSAMSVQPFGKVDGDSYKTGATTTDTAWYVYVASDLTYGYLPAIIGEQVAIDQPDDCAPQVQAATDPLRARIDRMKALTSAHNATIQNA